jgi:hypothetical protein
MFNYPAQTLGPMVKDHHQFGSLDFLQKVMDSLKKLIWRFEFKSLQYTFYIAENPKV